MFRIVEFRIEKLYECKRQSAKRGEQIIAHLLPSVCPKTKTTWPIPFPLLESIILVLSISHVEKLPDQLELRQVLNKRYGCIFRCLRYRAVHIETANDLSTDSFIHAVFRFVARRGPPSIIYSDNGANFTGAEINILDAMRRWNQEKITSSLQKKEIKCRFNPPAASHYGGVWERLIRSIRKYCTA